MIHFTQKLKQLDLYSTCYKSEWRGGAGGAAVVRRFESKKKKGGGGCGCSVGSKEKNVFYLALHVR